MSTSGEPIKRSLRYDEVQAIVLLKKSLCSKPWIVEELIKGVSKEMAYDIIKQVRVELNQLLEVNRAFAAACQALIKEKQDEPTSLPLVQKE